MRQRHKPKYDSVRRQLMMAGWRRLASERGHLAVTPSPPVIADASARRYELDRNDEGRWYSVYVDPLPGRGRCIDQRVPEEEFPTLGEALYALIAHVHERVNVKGLNENGTKEPRP